MPDTFVELGQLLENSISYGVVQPGNHVPNGVPLIRVQDLQNDRAEINSLLAIDPRISQKHSKTLLQGGELLISLVGTVGLVKKVPPQWAGFNVARAIGVVKSPHTAWLYYAFQTPHVRDQIDMVLNTTVQATLNLRDLNRLHVPFPDETQRLRILNILDALDDKIEANTKLAHIADELLRSLWVSWLSENAAAAKATFGEFATNIKEAAHSLGDANTQYLGLEHFDRRSVFLSRVGDASEVTSNKSVFQQGDTLFGKLRPYFHKVSQVPYHGICSTDILALRAISKEQQAFVTLVASSDEMVEIATRESGGTRMPRANWETLSRFEVPFPDTDTVNRLSNTAQEIIDATYGYLAENKKLEGLRDYLLPRLMSGKITVREAEDMVS